MEVQKRYKQAWSFISSSSEMRILIIIILMSIFASIGSPYFLSFGNIINLVESVAVLSIITFGATFVLLVGLIDISGGSTMAIVAIVTGTLLNANVPVYIAILAGFATGLFVGAINGIFIELFNFPFLIVTLAMMGILRGIVYLSVSSAPLAPYDNNIYFFLANGKIFKVIPFPVVITITVLIILSFILFKTIYGRLMIMTGAKKQAANISGINTRVIRFSALVIYGLLAALSGLLLSSKLKSPFPEFGQGYELRAIAAAVIGGVTLFGGRGSFIGAFLGAIVIGLLFNILDLMKVDPYWQYVVVGLTVLIAILSDKLISTVMIRGRAIRAK